MLSLGEDGDLTLSYGQDESYRFRDCGSCMVLDSAQIGDFRLYTDPESLDTDGETLRYWAEDAAGKAYAGIEITLDDFNIRLFPHSTAEVRIGYSKSDPNSVAGAIDKLTEKGRAASNR